MEYFGNWLSVITNPYSAATSAVLILLYYIIHKSSLKQRNWLVPAFVLMVFILLLGSLVLAWKVSENSDPIKIIQKSEGEGGFNIGIVKEEGQVIFNSNGNAEGNGDK